MSGELRFFLGRTVEVGVTIGTRLAGAQLRAIVPIRIIFIKFQNVFLSLIIVGVGVVGRPEAKPAAPKGLFFLVQQLVSLAIGSGRAFAGLLLPPDGRGFVWRRDRRLAGTVKWFGFVCRAFHFISSVYASPIQQIIQLRLKKQFE